MTPNDVTYKLDTWLLGVVKNFKYYLYTLYGPEYLIISRKGDNLFEVDLERSSAKVGPFNKETIEKLLGSDSLVEFDFGRSNNYKYYKSNGCNCGAYATSEPECHAYYCNKFK